MDFREEALREAGWVKADVGCIRKRDYNDEYKLHIRKRRLKDVLENRDANKLNDCFARKKSNEPVEDNSKNAVKSRDEEALSDRASNNTMGAHNSYLTPTDTLPALSHFDNFESLRQLNANARESLVLAFDTEFYYRRCSIDKLSGYRNIISYQFACVYDNNLYEFIFTCKRNGIDYGLSAELCVGRILDELGYSSVDKRKARFYKCITDGASMKEVIFDDKETAVAACAVPYKDGKKVKITYDYSGFEHIDVTLLCHAGIFDITAFTNSYDNKYDILGRCKEIGGGIVTTLPVKMCAASLKERYNRSGNVHVYPVSLHVSDTMCHTSKDKAKLEDLGVTVGFPKIKVEPDYKNHMECFYRDNIGDFFEYASNDCIVTLMYAASLYGFNKRIPLTIISAGCKVFKKHLYDLMECSSEADFEKRFRGHKKVGHGKQVDRINGKCVYNESSSFESLNPNAYMVQGFCSSGYHGGYNICLDVGYYPRITYDYDLKGAYSLGLSLIPEINWNAPIKEEIIDRDLTLDDFIEDGKYNPLKMMICFVTFEFPTDCKFPCIQVPTDEVPVYPRTSAGCEGVYACGPELYLALRQGAKVYVEKGLILNTNVNGERVESYSIKEVIKDFVKDRSKAKKLYGNDCLEQYILKLLINSIYGKISQDVVGKSHWDNYKRDMEDIGCSAITNPVIACFTTAIIRSVLIAAITQVDELGYTSFSVTTDGFISDIPEDKLKELDLYGFKPLLCSIRSFLTDGADNVIWEVKHVQDDLLNFSTRGNVSLHNKETYPMFYKGEKYAGVCAHLGMKSGYEPDTLEDRLWLYYGVVKRSNRIEVNEQSFTSLKDLQLGRSKDFIRKNDTMRKSGDFDLKRKPVKESMISTYYNISGDEYEIVNFTTVPFENIQEFERYRTAKKSIKCLRTREDFIKLDLKLIEPASKNHIRDLDKAIIMSCIKANVKATDKIPALLALKTREAKLEWLNRHYVSGKKLTVYDWRNANRGDRVTKRLPDDLIKEKYDELMMATDYEDLLENSAKSYKQSDETWS